MIKAYIPSKDRPMQCDALLRSLKQNAPFIQPTVVYTYSNSEFANGYERLIDKHSSWVDFKYEWNSEEQFYEFLEINAKNNDIICLFADDCIFFRKTSIDENILRHMFTDVDLWTFTYRLGKNISVRDYVYPGPTVFPREYIENNLLFTWQWDKVDFWDLFGFTVAFDGYVYRAQDLLTLSERSSFERICFWESMICRKFNENKPRRTWMAAPIQSTVFVQQINTTHDFQHNTTGHFNKSCKDLNDEWLQGKEIDLSSINWENPPVNCTHGERPFQFCLAEKIK